MYRNEPETKSNFQLSFVSFIEVDKKTPPKQVMQTESLKYRKSENSQIFVLIYEDRLELHTKFNAGKSYVTKINFDQIERVLPEENLFLTCLCFKVQNRRIVSCFGFKEIAGYYHLMSNLSEYRGWVTESKRSNSDASSEICKPLKNGSMNSADDVHQTKFFNLSNDLLNNEQNITRTSFVTWDIHESQNKKKIHSDAAPSNSSATCSDESSKRQEKYYCDRKFKKKYISIQSNSLEVPQRKRDGNTSLKPEIFKIPLVREDNIYNSPNNDNCSVSSTVYEDVTYKRQNTRITNPPGILECKQFGSSSPMECLPGWNKFVKNRSRSSTNPSSTSSLELTAFRDPVGRYNFNDTKIVHVNRNKRIFDAETRLPRR